MAPPRTDDDWSDSDSDDGLSQVETSVLLGVPDGAVEAAADRIDAAVSRIGGLPALLPSREPPFESSHCKSCGQPMELLVQMWCPFEDSPMDRALYIWGCARVGCQGKDGSVRAFRGIRTNEAYAQKLAKKRERQEQRERDRAKADEERARQEKQRKELFREGGGNPFAMGAKAGSSMPAFGAGFGVGAQIFGGAPVAAPDPVSSSSKETNKEPQDKSDDEADSDEDDDDDEEEEELLTALAATSISDSAWTAAPSYPPLYLSTTSEYVPPEPKPKIPKDALVDALLDDDDKGKKGKGGDGIESWAKEAYENSMDVDQVFERFMKRVGYEGEQCVRYELNGTPLPFASDATFDLLWPAPRADPLPVTKPAFKVVHPQRRLYDPSGVAKCARCGGRRVFECQLMPNLINVLRASESDGKKSTKKMTDEERRAAVERALKGQDKDARGMEWGTCMVFSCEKDCCVEGGKEAKEAWREEVVLVQWDA
ncbi:hypothetical protein D9619_013450 [Psilocybe cf. subviscida]|uniref:Programmed cell death protein 2 C-terminal domain-containing protein n=1 Tax=Psilocybe cf. subviscida TaxID=2480587 RepID=A0A8H5BS16_9AGAR|nr:hypothetical protein D9619_013450 [Psilocybe cf. subviscida]